MAEAKVSNKSSKKQRRSVPLVSCTFKQHLTIQSLPSQTKRVTYLATSLALVLVVSVVAKKGTAYAAQVAAEKAAEGSKNSAMASRLS